jgi:hypothetical protein
VLINVHWPGYNITYYINPGSLHFTQPRFSATSHDFPAWSSDVGAWR